jgi:signal transduction histidine kinase
LIEERNMLSRAAQRIRPVDVVIAGILCALAAWLAVLNIRSTDPTFVVNSHSWLQLPLFVAATLPVLWWRRSLIGALLTSSALMLAHVFAFGHLTRCGSGLPLVLVFGFLSGIGYSQRRERLTALALSVVLGAVVLMWDTSAGPTLTPVVAVIQVALYAIGRVVAHRAGMASELRQHNEDLRVLRDERAALEVSDDRLQLSARLEALLEQRLSQLAAVAEEGKSADPVAMQALLVTLEEDSRRTLGDMREIVGQLRGGEVALAPAPSVAHLDALLARHVHGGSRLQVIGDPRVLPPSVELSAYRIVEYLVTALADKPAAPVGVTMTFTDDALNIMVAGTVAKGGADLRGAVGRARQRALLHAGSLDLKLSRGRARVMAHLPVLGDV